LSCAAIGIDYHGYLLQHSGYLICLAGVLVGPIGGEHLICEPFFAISYWQLFIVVRYTGSTHGKSGAVLLLLSCLVTAVDFVPMIVRQFSILGSIRFAPINKWAWKARALVTRKSQRTLPADEEYLPITQSTDKDDGTIDEIDMLNFTSNFDGQHTHTSNGITPWNLKGPKNHRHILRHSLGSDHSTLQDEPRTPSMEVQHTLSQRIIQVGKLSLMVLERSLVPYAWGQLLSGFVIYFGLGRTHYVTGVLAHFISKHTLLTRMITC
jgi:hypothetical protein